MANKLAPLGLASLFLLAPAAAAIKGNAASQALVAEADALVGQRKFNEALDKYRAAAKADPTASSPVSMIANLYAMGINSPDRESARSKAEETAMAALGIDDRDPVAQETLRHVRDGGATPLHKASGAAAQLFNEGEDLFAQRQVSAALAKYEAAMLADPAFSPSWVMAGDCFFVQQQWAQAEARFRKATEIEPLNAQAWRFLSDALVHQERYAEAEVSLMSAIAAHPGQLPSWGKLSDLQHPVLPVAPLRLLRKARAKTDSSGKVEIALDPSIYEPKPANEVDRLFWITYILTEATANKGTGTSPYQNELEAWRKGLQVAAEIMEKKSGDWNDPALRTMSRLARDGQLETAVLLLHYKEAYRKELEEWKRLNPNGVKTFIARYGLRP
jgi:tetratricopeptide (TPR) repeat protein